LRTIVGALHTTRTACTEKITHQKTLSLRVLLPYICLSRACLVKMMIIVAATCIIIAPKRLTLRLSGAASKPQKRFRDTPMFKFRAILAQIQPKTGRPIPMYKFNVFRTSGIGAEVGRPAADRIHIRTDRSSRQDKKRQDKTRKQHIEAEGTVVAS
jgi:hypothetical protein